MEILEFLLVEGFLEITTQMQSYLSQILLVCAHLIKLSYVVL